MFRILSVLLFTVSTALVGCSDSDNNSPAVTDDSEPNTNTEESVGSPGTDQGETVSEPSISRVTYRVTFSDSWTTERFPTQFPASRHFSGLIGASHNEQVIFWEQGQPATSGIREMAELGSKSLVENEINTRIADGSAFEVLSGGGIGNSPASVSVEFDVNSQYPEVTLVSMVAPSPDWFVGVNNLDLRDSNGNFVDALLVPLVVYDAGTDSGATFTSSDSASPGEVITKLTCDSVSCDFNDGIHRNSGLSDRFIGEFLFERLTQ